jgi:hypothetical protein
MNDESKLAAHLDALRAEFPDVHAKSQALGFESRAGLAVTLSARAAEGSAARNRVQAARAYLRARIRAARAIPPR